MKLAINPFLSLGFALAASAIAGLPAMAVSLTNPTIGGTNPTDYTLRFTHQEDPTIPLGFFTTVTNTQSNLNQIFAAGGPGNPGGHVELAASSELPGFNFTKNTSLNGFLGSDPITLSSLTADDWFANSNALTKQYLSDALAANPGIVLPSGVTFDQLVAGFIASKGPQRFSDPNITYVSENNGNLTIGLAGVLNASDLLKQAFPGATVPNVAQASELVKVTYKGKTSYYYTFSFSSSNQSGSGGSPGCVGGPPSNYPNFDAFAKCSYTGDNKVPEPSSLLGLLAVGGGLLAIKRGGKKS